MYRRITKLIAIASACIATIGAVAASADTAPSPASASATKPVVTFAGKVAGTKSYVAVVTRGGRVEAYICDSVKTAVWLKGVHKRRVVSAVNAAKKVRLNAQVTGSTLTGDITLAGKRHSIRLAKVSYPAGLWKAFGLVRGKLFEGGWIVLPNRSQRGAGKFPPDGSFQPVKPVNTVQLSAGQAFSIAGISASTSPPAGPPPDPVTNVSCLSVRDNWERFNAAYNNPNSSNAAREAALRGMNLNISAWGSNGCQSYFGNINTELN